MAKNRYFTIRVENDLYAGIAKQAELEGRTPSNLAEVLLRWAFARLQAAGNSLALIVPEPDRDAIARLPRGVLDARIAEIERLRERNRRGEGFSADEIQRILDIAEGKAEKKIKKRA